MKWFTLFIVLVLISANAAILYSQDSNFDCRIKVEALQGTYSGDCAKGWANGQGQAHGTDNYVGAFRKGVPHGEGTYTWANGDVYSGEWKKGKRHGPGDFTELIDGRDSTLTGYWRRDKYSGTRLMAKYFSPKGSDLSDAYDVTLKRNIERIKFYNYEGEDEIEITVEQGGRRVRFNPTFTDISSGFEAFDGERFVITSPSFPFTCKLRYDLVSQFGTQIYVIEVHFVIYSAGEWRVIFAH